MYQEAINAVVPVAVANPDLTVWLNGLSDQAFIGFMVVGVMNYIKRASWFPWLNANSENLTKWVSNIAAIVAAVGVQIHITGSWEAGWVCSPCSTPPAHAMFTSIGRIFGQKAFQSWLYHNTKSPQPVTAVPAEPMNGQGKPIV